MYTAIKCDECQQEQPDRSWLFNGRCMACQERRRCVCGHSLDQHKSMCVASATSYLGIRLRCECQSFKARNCDGCEYDRSLEEDDARRHDERYPS